MPLELKQHWPVMCLTRDDSGVGHVEQVSRLCAAGARWIQLRMKRATAHAWLATAREVVAICRRHDAICIINDSVDVALASGADGVHLGQEDLDWTEARRKLGARAILGGTVNNGAQAARVQAAGGLDYVGVGPLRFTTSKEKLAPVVGVNGVRELIQRLGSIPAWVIGGVEPADLAELRVAGAAGIAVTGALYRGGTIEQNFRSLQVAWDATAPVAGGAAALQPTSGI